MKNGGFGERSRHRLPRVASPYHVQFPCGTDWTKRSHRRNRQAGIAKNTQSGCATIRRPKTCRLARLGIGPSVRCLSIDRHVG